MAFGAGQDPTRSLPSPFSSSSWFCCRLKLRSSAVSPGSGSSNALCLGGRKPAPVCMQCPVWLGLSTSTYSSSLSLLFVARLGESCAVHAGRQRSAGLIARAHERRPRRYRTQHRVAPCCCIGMARAPARRRRCQEPWRCRSTSQQRCSTVCFNSSRLVASKHDRMSASLL